MKINIMYGPPGTGKTTELLKILEEELKTVSPSSIAYVSFTKEGSEQGKTRAINKFDLSPEDFPYFRTLHSLAFREINLRRDCVMSKYHYARFSKKMGMNFTGYYTEEFKNNDDLYLFFDEVYRNTPKAANFYMDTLDSDKLSFVRKNYKAYKEQFALYDFTDMVEMFVERAQAVPVRVAFIDEAQDLTSLQWKMVWTAFAKCERIYIAGDDDQAIYEWSGADVEYFLSLEGESKVLRHSHRVPESIMPFATLISSQIKKRVEKAYTGTGERGELKYINSLEEIVFNPNETYMILSRNNCFLKDAEELAQSRGEIYSYKNTPSIKFAEVQAINLYEKVRASRIMSTSEEQSLMPFLKKEYNLNNPWYDSFELTEDRSAYLRNVIKRRVKIGAPNIRISTIHGVKGGEADNVIMMMDMTKSTFANLQKNPDSEHRVFYVGATRAKKRLYIMYSGSRVSYPFLRPEDVE